MVMRNLLLGGNDLEAFFNSGKLYVCVPTSYETHLLWCSFPLDMCYFSVIDTERALRSAHLGK